MTCDIYTEVYFQHGTRNQPHPPSSGVVVSEGYLGGLVPWDTLRSYTLCSDDF